MSITKVAVIGAGVMGAGIAAQLSNAGIPVYLLDIVPSNATDRNTIAKTALDKMSKAEPAPFMHKNNAQLITAGNIEDDLYRLSEVDWVIEAVVENAPIKKSLYKKLLTICSPDCLISSNTSTLPLHVLVQDMPERFKQQFMISHFFNPPRYMRLLELVTSADTRPDLVANVREFADVKLGKTCVFCKDTPGFIANRIGIYWLQCALVEAFSFGLTVEQVDMIMSTPFGVPKTGVFGLLDLIGLDLLPTVLDSMAAALPPDDAFHEIHELPRRVATMIAEGYTGRKGKGGFYRMTHIDGKRVKESINLLTGEYNASEKPQLNGLQQAWQDSLATLLAQPDTTTTYACRVWAKTLRYAASLVPEITDDIAAIDAAMREGYNWRYGPFELLDLIGVEHFVELLAKKKLSVPPFLANNRAMYSVQASKLSAVTLSGQYRPVLRDAGVLLLSDIKLHSEAILSNPSASLWDTGDGVACLEFHSKMNTLDMNTMDLLQSSLDKVSSEFSALVIHNDAENFSAGANLDLLMQAIHNSDWAAVEQLIRRGQQTYRALKYAPFPVVGAPSGLALGGGCEILLHCDAIQAHAELYIGLVEVGVGLIPSWGGCTEYLQRCFALRSLHGMGGPIPPILKAFQTIGLASVAKSAFEAKDLLFLSSSDGITMNKNRLLADAKAKALSLCNNYQPPVEHSYSLPGKTVQVLLTMGINTFHLLGKATTYDVVIAEKLARVLSGGDCDITEPVTEQALLALELEGFLDLVQRPETLARLEHTLKTGKPLRN